MKSIDGDDEDDENDDDDDDDDDDRTLEPTCIWLCFSKRLAISVTCFSLRLSLLISWSRATSFSRDSTSFSFIRFSIRSFSCFNVSKCCFMLRINDSLADRFSFSSRCCSRDFRRNSLISCVSLRTLSSYFCRTVCTYTMSHSHLPPPPQ